MPGADSDARRTSEKKPAASRPATRSGSREYAGGELVADRYELRTRLGRGGMGEVWSGRDTRLHRDVAVKLFVGGAGMEPSSLPDWLRREGIAAAQIVHPNVAVLYDQGAHRDHIYLVLELVNGATLAEIMNGGRLPLREALSYGAQVAEALAAAHAARVVHRDIKPQNVLITPDGTVKVVDFGIAGFLADTRSWTIARFDQTVKGSGTPDYAAPEQVMGHNADARSDLYSLGTLLYAMIAGQTPFRANDFLAVMHKKATEDAPRLPAGSGAPPAVADLVAELLVRDPEQRPSSARQIAQRLRTLMERPGRAEAEVEVEGADSLDRKSRVEVGAGPAAAEPWTAPNQKADKADREHEAVEAAKPEPGADSAGGAEPPAERPESSAERSGPRAGHPEAPAGRPASPADRPESPAGRSGSPAAGSPSAPAAGRSPADAGPKPARPQPKKPAPAESPETKPSVWGSSKEHVTSPETSAWEPLAATGATVLSAVAEVELRGRSLLPPPARSLLANRSSGERYVPSPAQPQQPQQPQIPAAPAGPARRGPRPLVLIVVAAVVVAVVVVLLVAL